MNDDRLHRIENKIDKVVEHIASIDVTLGEQHVSLKDHIRRTEILEEQIKPISRHVDMVVGVGKFLSWFAGAVGFAAAVAELIYYIRTGNL